MVKVPLPGRRLSTHPLPPHILSSFPSSLPLTSTSRLMSSPQPSAQDLSTLCPDGGTSSGRVQMREGRPETSSSRRRKKDSRQYLLARYTAAGDLPFHPSQATLFASIHPAYLDDIAPSPPALPTSELNSLKTRLMGLRGPRPLSEKRTRKEETSPLSATPTPSSSSSPLVNLPSKRNATRLSLDPKPPIQLRRPAVLMPVNPTSPPSFLNASSPVPRTSPSPRLSHLHVTHPRLFPPPPPLKFPHKPPKLSTPPFQVLRTSYILPPHLIVPPLSPPSSKPVDVEASEPLKPSSRPRLTPSLSEITLKASLVNLLTSSSRCSSSQPVEQAPHDEAMDPVDLAWSLYSRLGSERLPPSLLSVLFNSQRVRDIGTEDRARRLLRIVSDASRDPPLVVPSTSALGEDPRWWLSLEQVEVAFHAALKVVEEGLDASRADGLVILVRDVWRTMTQLGAGGRQPDARRKTLMWRWIRLVVGPSEEEGDESHQHCPTSRTARVAQLARFLDLIGPPSRSGVCELARSFQGSVTDPELADEIKTAIEMTERFRRRRDASLRPPKTRAFEEFKAEIPPVNPYPHQAPVPRGQLSGLGDGKDVQSWINELLRPSDSESVLDFERSAPSLLHRATTSILLLSHLERNILHEVPLKPLALIFEALHHLFSLPPAFHLPIPELRLLTTTVLNTYPTLQPLETADIHLLLLAFVSREDLPFAERVYRRFRLREPDHVLPGQLLQDLLRLALGTRSLAMPEAEAAALVAHDGILASDVYADYISQGNPPLSGSLLFTLVAEQGRRPGFGGVAFRALSDSISYHDAEDVLTDELMVALANATSRRILRSVCEADLHPTSVSSTDLLTDLLPILRSFCPPPRTVPSAVFSIAFNLVQCHPSAANLALVDATFQSMLDYGPAPTVDNINEILRALLRTRKDKAAEYFEQREPYDVDARINIERIVELVEIMTTRLGLKPNGMTWSRVVEGFCAVGQVDVALETFRFAHSEGMGPVQMGTTRLMERLMEEGRAEEAYEVYERWREKYNLSGTARQSPKFAAATHAVEEAYQVLQLSGNARFKEVLVVKEEEERARRNRSWLQSRRVSQEEAQGERWISS